MASGNGLDVSNAINLGGPNVLVIDSDHTGFIGAPDLWRQPAILARISLAGNWRVQVDEDHGTQEAAIPGSFMGIYATKLVTIPASWSKSHVFLRVEPGPDGGICHLAINDRVLFYDSDPPQYMDVTPWIKFGKPNQILVLNGVGKQWSPGKANIATADLEEAKL